MILYKVDSHTEFSHHFVDFLRVEIKISAAGWAFSDVRKGDIVHMPISNFGVGATNIEIIWGDSKSLEVLKNIGRVYGSS